MTDLLIELEESKKIWIKCTSVASATALASEYRMAGGASSNLFCSITISKTGSDLDSPQQNILPPGHLNEKGKGMVGVITYVPVGEG